MEITLVKNKSVNTEEMNSEEEVEKIDNEDLRTQLRPKPKVAQMFLDEL